MNPVISYNDFMNFMRWSSNDRDQLLPVILIKPSTILYLNGEHRINHIFDYFDRRSGKEIQFFLPGYSYYPSLKFAEILPSVRPYNENAVALKLKRLKNIYYSDNDFIEFVELLENNAPNFRYYGDTELIFIKYIHGAYGELGMFDFNTIYRFNLSSIYYSKEEKFYSVEHFLEEVLHIMHYTKNDDELIKEIKSLLD